MGGGIKELVNVLCCAVLDELDFREKGGYSRTVVDIFLVRTYTHIIYIYSIWLSTFACHLVVHLMFT